ncbi:MAG: hypothetical protein BWK80_41620 [Desulfobacteraceae bacterium IS3]|nr:MAG: hypothetical protein BWK80_41620 [Desulfobacteraceae bacterium IS3]
MFRLFQKKCRLTTTDNLYSKLLSDFQALINVPDKISSCRASEGQYALCEIRLPEVSRSRLTVRIPGCRF